MRRLSERQSILRALEGELVAIAVMSRDLTERDPYRDHLEDIYFHVSGQRYLGPRLPVPKQQNYFNLLDDLDDLRFRNEVRMSRDAFYFLLARLKKDPIFKRLGKKPQAPVKVQLVVTLSRLGQFGNGARIGKIARTWGIAEGTVLLYTSRCITALNNIRASAVYWPSPDEREAISEEIHSISSFPNCVGFVDGTHIPLFQCPAKDDGEDYFNRKKSYSFNAMVVNDHTKRIRFTTFGHVGSAHDTRVWFSCPLATDPDTYFSADEYLLADSGYPSGIHTVCTYKAPAANRPENKRFNYRIAKLRICNEHCIGMLKSRFTSLRGLRLMVRDGVESAKLAAAWFSACCVLHNLLLRDGWVDQWTEDQRLYELSLLANGRLPPPVLHMHDVPSAKRDAVRDYVLARLDAGEQSDV